MTGSNNKNISVPQVVTSQDIMMGDINLKQPLPVRHLQNADPFLLLHHVGPLFQNPHEKSVLDIGGHPHRGFEPITFIFKGQVHHRDSRGHDSIIEEGGVQWMTAGMGIVHSESAPKSFVEEGGELELIQLWVNLPSSLKMNQPRYQGFQKQEIPALTMDKGKVVLNVISGKYFDTNGPVESITGIQSCTIQMENQSTVEIALNEEYRTLIYQLNGKSRVNRVLSNGYDLSVLPMGSDTVKIEADTDSLFLMVSGLPINEPIAQHGPFVMNTQTEILEAMRDYQMGKMGVLI